MKNKYCTPIIFVLLCFAQMSEDARATSLEDSADMKPPRVLDTFYKAREIQIKNELGKSAHEQWAGKYHHGDGLGTNVSVLVAPKAGFIYKWEGCMGLYAQNYGEVKWSANKVEFTFKLTNDLNEFGLSPELVPILWGKRHYLIPTNKLIDFANAINAGSEPCKKHCYQFLIKSGDEKRSVKGLPNLPDGFQNYLLSKPLHAGVISIGDSRIQTSNRIPEFQTRITKITLNVGSEKGVLSGMEFYVVSPKNIFETAKITKVDEHQSEAEIHQFGMVETIPSIAWSFSTRIR